MRIRPLAGLSERGFSFDLVSRKKTARAEEAPEAGAEHEAPTGNPTLQLTDPILDDPDLMVEPFEIVAFSTPAGTIVRWPSGSPAAATSRMPTGACNSTAA